MRMTKCAAVMGLTVGDQRQLANPLALVHQQYLLALRVSATSFTAPQRGYRDEEGKTSATRAMADLSGRNRPRAAKPLPRGSDATAPPLAGSAGAMTSGRGRAMSGGMMLYGETQLRVQVLLKKL